MRTERSEACLPQTGSASHDSLIVTKQTAPARFLMPRRAIQDSQLIARHRPTIPFIFPALGCTLQPFDTYVMASTAKRSNVHTSKANPRATFKLFGQAPMQATILSRNRAGFWIQGGKLAAFLGDCDYSGVDVDVCFLSANKVEWYKLASAASNAAATGK